MIQKIRIVNDTKASIQSEDSLFETTFGMGLQPGRQEHLCKLTDPGVHAINHYNPTRGYKCFGDCFSFLISSRPQYYVFFTLVHCKI